MERVDDTDSRIRYTPATAWINSGKPGENNGTTHGSRSSPAEMFFQFNGTYIAVYGTITLRTDLPAPVDEFIVDGLPPKQFAPTLDGVAHMRHMMFSATLEDGFHTLVMNRMVNNSESWIDYIDFTPGKNSPFSSSLSPPLPSSTQSDNNDAIPPSKSLLTGALIAVVVVCVVLLVAILVLTLLLLRRRRARAAQESNTLKPSATNVPVEPVRPTRPTRSPGRYMRRGISQPQSVPVQSEILNGPLSVPSIRPLRRLPPPLARPRRYVVNKGSESANSGSVFSS